MVSSFFLNTLSATAVLLASSISVSAGSAGCGQDTTLKPGHSKRQTIQSAGGLREYIIHLPSSYDQNNATGLILSFHGNTKTDTNQETISQFSNETWNPDHIAVYPQGLGDQWEGAPYNQTGVSDKNFTSDLLDLLENTLCIDTSRIYATGMSLGGGFCNVLACSPTVGGRFAAFAPVSGAFYTGNADDGSDCHPARSPLPMLEFHGGNDTVIPWDGGIRHDVPVPAITDWLARWANRNGCPSDTQPTITTKYSGVVHHYSYPCHTHHYKTDGWPHEWPAIASGAPFDATPMIMSFFNSVTNPN